MKKILEAFTEKRLQILILLVLVLSALGAGLMYWSANTYDEDSYVDRIESAEGSRVDSAYGEALKYYLEAIDIAPRELDGYLGVIEVLSLKTRFEDAEAVVKGAITSLSLEDYSNLWAALGDGYRDSGNLHKAYECYEQSYKYDSSDFKAAKVIDYALSAGELVAAEGYYSRLSKPEEYEISNIWLKYIKNMDEDVELYDIALASQDFINSQYPYLTQAILESRIEDIESYWEGMYFLGRARFDLGDYSGAIVAFEDAVILGSDDYQLFLYLARSNNEILEKNTAYKYYDRAIEFAPDREVHQIIDEYVHILIEDEQYIRAEEALSSYSDENWAQLIYMELYFSQSEWGKFEEYSDEYNITGIENGQTDKITYYQLLVEYNLDLEEPEIAQDYLNEFSEVTNDQSSIFLYSGKILLLEDDSSEAVKMLNKAIDADLYGDVTKEADKLLKNIN